MRRTKSILISEQMFRVQRCNTWRCQERATQYGVNAKMRVVAVDCYPHARERMIMTGDTLIIFPKAEIDAKAVPCTRDGKPLKPHWSEARP